MSSERAISSVKRVNEKLISAQISRYREAIGHVEVDRVRVGFPLPIRIDARSAVLNKSTSLQKLSRVFIDAKCGDAAPAVVRHQDRPPLVIDYQVARRRAS